MGVEEHSALHALAVQSPTPESLHRKGKTLVNHYTEVILERIKQIKALTAYLVVDGYFMKKDFIAPLLWHKGCTSSLKPAAMQTSAMCTKESKSTGDAKESVTAKLTSLIWIKEE